MLHNSSKHFLFLCQWMCFVPSVWQQLCKNAREQLFCWKDVTHYGKIRLESTWFNRRCTHHICEKGNATCRTHDSFCDERDASWEERDLLTKSMTSKNYLWEVSCDTFFLITIERRRRRGTGKFQDPSAPLQSNNIKFEARQHLPLVEHI